MVGKNALILGASSGFGKATALKFSQHGYRIFGVHLDRKATLPQVEDLKQQIEKNGGKAVYFNANAADPDKIREISASIKEELGNEKLHVVMHSLAFATLKLFIDEPNKAMTRKNIEMTMDVMANSLIYWVQELYWQGIIGEGTRIFAMTSSGSSRAIPYYGGVSAAKAALEAYIRQLALELGPQGIKANAINAGVTDTPALRKIPGAEELAKGSMLKNPAGRLTTPEDVANAIYVLSLPEANWINGDVISVDNGESHIEFKGSID